MKIIRLDDMFSFILPGWWQSHMTPANKGLVGCDELLIELRKHAPAGTVESHQNMPVILMPGKVIAEHKHKQWTLIYMIDVEDTQPLMVDGVPVWPADNTAILLEPNVPHSVLRNTSDRPRLSLALRFHDADTL